MSNTDDIARIGYVIDNYDTIRLLTNENGDPILSAEWVNSDGTHAKQIELTKKIDGTYYVIEAAIDTQKKTLMVTSAYMNQKGSAAQSLNMEQSPPQLTSQTPNGFNASVPNIPQGKAQVNTEFDNGLGVNPEFRQDVAADSRRYGDAEATRDAEVGVPYDERSLNNGTGESVDEGGERYDGLGTGRQAGELEGGAGGSVARGEARKSDAGRKARIAALRADQSARDIGVTDGSDEKTLHQHTGTTHGDGPFVQHRGPT